MLCSFANMIEEALRLANEHGLERVNERIEHSIIPAIHLSKAERHGPVGASRLGGLPDLPPDHTWPARHGRPLGFISQIRCDELLEPDPEGLLPRTGMFYFFYDLEEQPWGFDPKDRGGASVQYIPDAGTLIPANPPDGLDLDKCLLPPFHVVLTPFPSTPHIGSIAFEKLQLKEDECDRYFNLQSAIDERFTDDKNPRHQLLGHACNIQGDMQLECQLVTNGLYCGDATGYQSPERKELERGAAEWRLLLQIDSDDDLGVMWGDCGMIYFWIREAAMKAKQFDRAWTILQCS